MPPRFKPSSAPETAHPLDDRPYHIAGKPLTCPHCAHHLFLTRRTLLNTRGMTLLELDWLNDAADNYICTRCGHIQWFYRLDSPAARVTEATECLSCHTTIPADATACPACGWTYE